MAKRKIKTVELDPELLAAEDVPHPCEGCKKKCSSGYYKHCEDWRNWFRVKFKEVKNRLKG